jgi:hypothetical protein
VGNWRGTWFLGSRLVDRLSRCIGDVLCTFKCARPHQYRPIFIGRETLSLNQLNLQILQRLVIKVKLPLEGPVRRQSATLEHLNGMFEDVIEGHGLLPTQPCIPFVNFLH